MAEIKEITIVDFVDWCKQQVDLADLSALMTSFGYADDSSETIADALEDSEFKAEFTALLSEYIGADKNYHDQQRANGELTIQDWLELATSQSFVRATGDTAKAAPWWMTVLGVVGGVIDGIVTPKEQPETATEKADRLQREADAKKSNNMMWIIVAVVVVAVIALLFFATRKK